MTIKINYSHIITSSINGHIHKGLIDQESIHALFPSTTIETIRKKIKQEMAKNHNLIGKVSGIYPDTNTIIEITESVLGAPINGTTLVQANLLAKKQIDKLTTSFLKDFCQKSLGCDYNSDTEKMTISLETLHKKLLTPYRDYLTKIDNALVSIAGTLNQSLLIRALRSAGLSDTTQPKCFSETGSRSEGDIQIYHTGAGKSGNKILYVEAKSYAARERLLRGLADIKTPKVGVGFFNNPSEFSAKRVELLATSAHTQAVYMPEDTYQNLTSEAKNVNYPGTGRVCRILESEFTLDMAEFNKTGAISHR